MEVGEHSLQSTLNLLHHSQMPSSQGPFYVRAVDLEAGFLSVGRRRLNRRQTTEIVVMALVLRLVPVEALALSVCQVATSIASSYTSGSCTLLLWREEPSVHRPAYDLN